MIAFFLENPTHIVSLIVTLLVAYPFASIYIGYLLIKHGLKIPQSLQDFPVHQTSQQKYLDIRVRVEEFMTHAINGDEDRFILSQDDLNNLSLKGNTINKREPGTYVHFQIAENAITYQCLAWPSWLRLATIYTNTCSITFRCLSESFSDNIDAQNIEYIPVCDFTIVEEESREFNVLTENYRISDTLLFACIFNFHYHVEGRSVLQKDSRAFQKALLVMMNIDQIKVENNLLVLVT
jgi:hypothetical protein